MIFCGQERAVRLPSYKIMDFRGVKCGEVVINLCTDDLEKEYRRIRGLEIVTELTDIRYVNAGNTYWYFVRRTWADIL